MIVRIYDGPDGKSCFEEIKEPAHMGESHANVRYTLRPAGSFVDWHNPQTPTYIITLTGLCEVEAEDGEKRYFGPGDILLAEDYKSKGHVSKNLGQQDRLFVSIAMTKE